MASFSKSADAPMVDRRYECAAFESRGDDAGPTDDGRDSRASFEGAPFLAAIRQASGLFPGIGSVVGEERDERLARDLVRPATEEPEREGRKQEHGEQEEQNTKQFVIHVWPQTLGKRRLGGQSYSCIDPRSANILPKSRGT